MCIDIWNLLILAKTLWTRYQMRELRLMNWSAHSLQITDKVQTQASPRGPVHIFTLPCSSQDVFFPIRFLPHNMVSLMLDRNMEKQEKPARFLTQSEVLMISLEHQRLHIEFKTVLGLGTHRHWNFTLLLYPYGFLVIGTFFLGWNSASRLSHKCYMYLPYSKCEKDKIHLKFSPNWQYCNSADFCSSLKPGVELYWAARHSSCCFRFGYISP